MFKLKKFNNLNFMYLLKSYSKLNNTKNKLLVLNELILLIWFEKFFNQ